MNVAKICVSFQQRRLNNVYCFLLLVAFFLVYIRLERLAEIVTLPPAVQAVNRSTLLIQISEQSLKLPIFFQRTRKILNSLASVSITTELCHENNNVNVGQTMVNFE